MKVRDLSGALLDYWVAKCERQLARISVNVDGEPCCMVPVRESTFILGWPGRLYAPSSNWATSGPIIERGLISLIYIPIDDPVAPGMWRSFFRSIEDEIFEDRMPLVAAMRAYVAAMFGDEVPDEVPA